MTTKIQLKKIDGTYAIARLAPEHTIPDWADGPGFVSISRTDDELSIICLQNRIPDGVRVEQNWICFKFMGPFAFDAAGVLLGVIRPLSEKGIGVLAISTFDGDVLLIKAHDGANASTWLRQAGHSFI